MALRQKRLNFRAVVERQSEAQAQVPRAGDTALVARGVPRSLVMRCPDGCGDILTVNLDPRSDKAWRFYVRDGHYSLYPSVWRDTGCGAHFIIWNDHIIWTDEWWPTETDVDLVRKVRVLLTDRYQAPLAMADSLDDIPWSVTQACRYLVKEGVAEEGDGKLKGHFRLREQRR